MEAGASELELQDLQEEMGMTRCVTNAAEQAEYKAAWTAPGVCGAKTCRQDCRHGTHECVRHDFCGGVILATSLSEQYGPEAG